MYRCSIKIVLLVFSISVPMFSQDFNSGDIVGTWLTENKNMQVHIYENNEKYFANATSTSGSLLTSKDKMNPVGELRNKTISEVLIIKNLIYDELGKWNGGKIYDPSNGKVYECKIEMVDIDNIKVTGYKLVSIFWKYEMWKRVK